MTKLTASQWNRLSEKAQWDIKVALRGPDANYGDTLKWFTTSVIRGKVSEVFRVGGLVNHDLNLIVIPRGKKWGDPAPVQEAYRKVGYLGWNYHHFIDHIKQAAAYLDLPELPIPAELWHRLMQGQSARGSGEELLTYLLTTDDSYLAPHQDELQRHLSEGEVPF